MRLFKKFNKLLFLFFLLTSLILSLYKQSLPAEEEVITYVKELEPRINKIEEESYLHEFSGVKYKITPLYSYEAYGVIVEHYDSDNWLDVVHQGDPAQTKDICIVWGENIKNDVYRQVKYSHGEFTCFVEAETREIWGRFNLNELTNNHLIPLNKQIEKKLKETIIGDQVYIKGKLVNYEILNENDEKIRSRTTSHTMEDRDCEVVLVEQYDIIKSTESVIVHLRKYSYWGLGLSTLLGLVLFIFV